MSDSDFTKVRHLRGPANKLTVCGEIATAYNSFQAKVPLSAGYIWCEKCLAGNDNYEAQLLDQMRGGRADRKQFEYRALAILERMAVALERMADEPGTPPAPAAAPPAPTTPAPAPAPAPHHVRRHRSPSS